jgi:hypothetical protein
MKAVSVAEIRRILWMEVSEGIGSGDFPAVIAASAA